MTPRRCWTRRQLQQQADDEHPPNRPPIPCQTNRAPDGASPNAGVTDLPEKLDRWRLEAEGRVIHSELPHKRTEKLLRIGLFLVTEPQLRHLLETTGAAQTTAVP